MRGNLSREKVSQEPVKIIDSTNLNMESSKVTDSLTVFDDTGSKDAHPKEGRADQFSPGALDSR